MSTSNVARKYARENSDRFKQELFEMLRIPSLSGDPAHAADVRRMAEWHEVVSGRDPSDCGL